MSYNFMSAIELNNISLGSQVSKGNDGGNSGGGKTLTYTLTEDNVFVTTNERGLQVKFEIIDVDDFLNLSIGDKVIINYNTNVEGMTVKASVYYIISYTVDIENFYTLTLGNFALPDTDSGDSMGENVLEIASQPDGTSVVYGKLVVAV